MTYPIVQIKTKDKLDLYGLFLESPKSKTVFMNIHGTAGNFYEEDFIQFIAEKLNEEGISLLSTNNRGASVYDSYERSGAATERFEDCLIDIDGWIEFVMSKGYKNIILSGHSLGTEKAVYYMTRGTYKDKIEKMVLLGPSDSYGCHRMYDGQMNIEAQKRTDELLKISEGLMKEGKGGTFLARDAYGGGKPGGIMPKTAESFVNFLGSGSKVLEALPFATRKLESYSKIKVPILAVIGDGEEYTAITTDEALELMKKENKNTQAVKLEDCNHDFQGKERELAGIIYNFISS
ncbi:MAG: alpha/beta fold hydrolase [Candidatus Paceibacterota bacterium]|jgi:pimeloyl-ACP methyl ester carboxylesterase